MRTIELAEMRFNDFSFRRMRLGTYAEREIGTVSFKNPDREKFDEATLDFLAIMTLHISGLAETEAAAKTAVRCDEAQGAAESSES